MMPGSRKATDLLRDPRFALHNATIDKNVVEGDAKISGRAVLVDDEETMSRHVDAFREQTGYPPPEGPFHLFRADVLEISSLLPEADHLNISWWRAGGPVQRVQRK